MWSIIVAAGEATRFGAPKQLQTIGGTQVVVHSVMALLEETAGVVLVCGQSEQIEGLPESVKVVAGGSSRSRSVRSGLDQIPHEATHVLVHDGARPLVSSELIQRVIAELNHGTKAVVPAIEVRDTLREVEGGTVDRSKFLSVQTPQGFSLPEFSQAHEAGLETTDDASIMEQAGHSVATVAGDIQNIKITYPIDMTIAEALYESK